MSDLAWGLMMLLVGMGSVFVMLFVLMIVLQLLGVADRVKQPEIQPNAEQSQAEPEALTEQVEVDPNAWLTIKDASGLTPEQITAISVAVSVHADLKRKQGAPSFREHAPGSRLWASRWVAMGRNNQMQMRRS